MGIRNLDALLDPRSVAVTPPTTVLGLVRQLAQAGTRAVVKMMPCPQYSHNTPQYSESRLLHHPCSGLLFEPGTISALNE